MTTEEAHEQILREIDAAGHVVTDRGQIDERHFGNFVIGFVAGDRPSRLVNDRGQIISYAGTGFDDGHLVIDDIYRCDGAAFSTALRSALQ